MGIQAGRSTRWLKDNRSALPSMAALLAVVAFWIAGAVGGVGSLAEASSPLMMLTGLYVGLAAVAVSIIVATLALNDLVSRYSRPRTRR